MPPRWSAQHVRGRVLLTMSGIEAAEHHYRDEDRTGRSPIPLLLGRSRSVGNSPTAAVFAGVVSAGLAIACVAIVPVGLRTTV